MIERRKFQRKHLEFPLQLRPISGDERMMRNSFSKDISETGAGITTFDFFPVNGKVHLKIFSNTLRQIMEIICKVVWIEQVPYQEKFKLGVEFIDNGDGVMRRIQGLIGGN
ncbi:MAG: PilZ domain-containing protein [Candidatus Omnitrophica bacterium]|nr:PilZ domain-containing protein [Candidatus Omnitrophota bacterium]